MGAPRRKAGRAALGRDQPAPAATARPPSARAKAASGAAATAPAPPADPRDLLLSCLDAAPLADEARHLALAAVLGCLDQAIDGSPIARPAPAAAAAASPRRAYLAGLTVEGFRGIGPAVELPLVPGPGLTLVVGRNGSGKSSFAEAIELLLTRDNARWRGRGVEWRQGWRNLHHPHSAIELRVALSGAASPLTLRCTWPSRGPDARPDDAGDPAAGTTTVAGAGVRTLDELGWREALPTYPPLLSYNQLGDVLVDGPSKLHDALAVGLGLGELTAALDDLKRARKALKDSAAAPRDALPELHRRLDALAGDPRAAACREALGGSPGARPGARQGGRQAARAWDLDGLEAVLLEASAGCRGRDVELLQWLAAVRPLALDTAAAAAARLRDALAALAAAQAPDAERSARVADLLRRALAHRAAELSGGSPRPADPGAAAAAEGAAPDCPVCRQPGALDAAWAEAAAAQAASLDTEAATIRTTSRELLAAEDAARRLLAPPPLELAEALALGLPGAAALHAAWVRLAAAPAVRAALASHLEEAGTALAAASEEANRLATAELAARDEAWRRVARALAEWLPAARRGERDRAAERHADAAYQWLGVAIQELQNERLAPVKERALAIWELLAERSNVEVRDVLLAGTGTRRRVDVAIAVDGTAGVALGVMSQGELHALALSLFLPRVTLPESPFGFLLIDDPVQAMDPAKVDGLARVLAEVARERQVVVFTHDARLPEAVRRLQIGARVLEVCRRLQSKVEVRPAGDPVGRLIEDAFAVAKAESMPEEARRRVVPGLCRQALEAAAMAAYRRKALARGEEHAAVEAALEEAHRLTEMLALAVFGTRERVAEVFTHLENKGGLFAKAGRVVRRCNDGAHGVAGVVADVAFIREAEVVARAIEGLK